MNDKYPELAALRAHQSIRHFTDEPVTDKQLEAIIATGQRSSTSSNLQAYSVIAVRDQVKKAKIAELCGGQPQVARCPVFLAHCADLNRAKVLCDECGYDFDANSMELFVVAMIDATIFAQTTLAAAEAIGLSGCMIGGARNKPTALAEVLELPPLVFVTFGMTLGHPQPEKRGPLRPRLPMEAVLHKEHYGTSTWDAAHHAYDKAMRETGIYNKRRVDLSKRLPGWNDHTPEGAYGWIEHAARRWIDPGARRRELREFLDRQGFGFE